MVKAIGLELKGHMVGNDYHMNDVEIELLLEGKIAVVGTTTYHHNPNGLSYKEHDYAVVNMDCVEKIGIFYDTEDDYMMHQVFYFKNGSSRFGMSRNHEEVKKWEALGIPIEKSYGY